MKEQNYRIISISLTQTKSKGILLDQTERDKKFKSHHTNCCF